MNRLLAPTHRFLLAGLIAGLGTLTLHAAEPLDARDAVGLDRAARDARAPEALSARVRDRHMLRVTVTDGHSLLTGITVASGPRTAITDGAGFAMLRVDGWPDVPVSFRDAEGVTIGGSILLPEAPAEGVDALVVVNGHDGTFDAVAAGESGPERAELAAAWSDLEREWLAAGFKEERPVATTFADGPGLQVPDDTVAPGGAVSSSLRLLARQSREEILDAMAQGFDPVRRHRARLLGAADDREPGLIDPVNEFQKSGYELMLEQGLTDETGISPKAGEAYEDILAEEALDEEASLALGAELLRQGADVEPTLASTVRDELAANGLTAAAAGLTLNSAGSGLQGGVVIGGLPGGSGPGIMAADAFEPDNSAAACSSITANGGSQTRSIDPGDFDWVCVTLNCGDTATLMTVGATGNTSSDTFIELYDPAGNLIGADDDSNSVVGTFSLDSLLITQIDTTGVYRMRVRGFSATTTIQNYSLSVTTTSGTCQPVDPSEPNNTSAACASITPGAPAITRWIRPLLDEDWYCFNVAACGTTITWTRTSPVSTVMDPIAPKIEVYSPSLALLSTSTATTLTTATSDVGLHYIRVLAPGTPVIPFADYSNATHTNTGSYTLAVTTAPPSIPCDAFEPDSTQAACNSLPLTGTIVPGHSIHPSDVDWYCFDLNCNDTVSITVAPTSGTLAPNVQLWGPTSTAAIQTSTGANGVTVTLTRAGNHAGRWYARVASNTTTSPGNAGTYNISATRTAVPNANCDGLEPDSSSAACRPPVDFAGGLQSKYLFPARDEDWICLGTLICGDTVTLRTWPTPPANTSVDTVIDLYKLPNVTTAVATNDEGGTGITPFSLLSYFVTSPAQAGTYVARVRHFSTTGTGPYDVSVNLVHGDCPTPDGFEPDDTQAACNALDTAGGPVSGHNIFPATDTDYYCVNFACGDNLAVTVAPTGGSLRAIVALLSPTGTVLQTATATANGLPVTLTTTDNNAGLHYIRVTSSTSTTGNYDITGVRTVGTCLFDPFEPDDTAAACRFIGLPRAESRAINPLTDSDFYCFGLDCGQGINVTVTPTSGTLQAVLRLRNSAGTTLTTVTSAAPGAPITLSSAVSSPGVYSIEVDQTGNTKGLYDITLQGFDAFACIDAYEPDNTMADCRSIATDGSLQVHTLLLHPDEDWVCFDVPDCGYRITAGTQPASPSYDDADTTVHLYGPSGNLLQSATTGGPASHGRLTRVVDEPGTYYVRIVPASTTATSTSGGQYDLSVTVEDIKAPLIVPTVDQTLLPNATQLDAQALTPSTGVYTMVVGADPFIDISTTGTWIDTGLISVVVPIGFTFDYFGNSYSNVAIHDNGLLSFSDPTWIPGIGNECIPDPSTPNEFIAAFWEDLDGNFTYYQTLGTAPNRQFIAQWNDGYFPVTLEVVLFEATGEISIRYLDMNGTNGNGQSATVGIEDLAGNGIQYSCNSASVFDGMSVSFVPTPPGLVDYPNNPACFPQPAYYDVAADTAPFIDISSTGTDLGVPPFTDDSFRTVPLPIVFPYFGLSETVLNVGSNGFATVGTGSTTLTNQCPLPNATTPNGVLAPFWDDLNPATGGNIYGQLFGTPGTGTAYYVVQWNQVPFFSVGGSNTFELILYESGLIEYRYGAMTATTRGSGDSATVGLEDRAGTNGVTYGCNTAGTVFDGLRLTFTVAAPPEPLQRFTWLDPDTMTVLGTGPTYLHPIDAPCDVLLRVEVRDPIACCTIIQEQLVTVPDRAAPAITRQPALSASGCQFLWPPNHGYADFSLADTGITAVDACDNGVIVRFSALSGSSQPEDEAGVGDGGSVDDIMISPDGQVVSVRAERSGNCDQIDRSYTLYIEVSDSLGNSTMSEPISVCVYHDQGHEPPGPYRGAEPGSDSDDTRPGWTEGAYGTDCGAGCSLDCDPTQILR